MERLEEGEKSGNDPVFLVPATLLVQGPAGCCIENQLNGETRAKTETGLEHVAIARWEVTPWTRSQGWVLWLHFGGRAIGFVRWLYLKCEKKKKEESRITPTFGDWATGRMEFLSTGGDCRKSRCRWERISSVVHNSIRDVH